MCLLKKMLSFLFKIKGSSLVVDINDFRCEFKSILDLSVKKMLHYIRRDDNNTS